MNRKYWNRNRFPQAFFEVVGHRRLKDWKALIYGEDAYLAGLISLAATIAGLILGFAIIGAFLEK